MVLHNFCSFWSICCYMLLRFTKTTIWFHTWVTSEMAVISSNIPFFFQCFFFLLFSDLFRVAELSNHVLESLSSNAMFVYHYTLLHRLLIATFVLDYHPSFGIFFTIRHHCIILTWCCVSLLTDTSLSSYWSFYLKHALVFLVTLFSIVDWYSQSVVTFSAVAILNPISTF